MSEDPLVSGDAPVARAARTRRQRSANRALLYWLGVGSIGCSAAGFVAAAGYRFARLSEYFGKFLRHGNAYPDRVLRLFDRRPMLQAERGDPRDVEQPAGVEAIRDQSRPQAPEQHRKEMQRRHAGRPSKAAHATGDSCSTIRSASCSASSNASLRWER